jgi:hypothetical protein
MGDDRRLLHVELGNHGQNGNQHGPCLVLHLNRFRLNIAGYRSDKFRMVIPAGAVLAVMLVSWGLFGLRRVFCWRMLVTVVSVPMLVIVRGVLGQFGV